MGGKRRVNNGESSRSKHKNKEIQVYIIKEKHSRYTPPTNQGWAEKQEGIIYESSHSKHKLKETQVSIITEKHSRYTPPTNQVWEEEEEEINH